MEPKKSPHILNASSNLLGFCLVVITSLHLSDSLKKSLIDEMTGVAALLLMAASMFSFFSIRSGNQHKSVRYERVADIIFVMAMAVIFITIIFIAFNIML